MSVLFKVSAVTPRQAQVRADTQSTLVRCAQPRPRAIVKDNATAAAVSKLEAAKVAAVASALTAALSLAPCQVSAVSGGGGLGTSLAGRDFSSQDLHNQKFYKADMRGSNFTKANLQGANLFGAFAKDAKFTDADLSNADVESVDFEGADLTNAVLTGVQATNARFKDTLLANTDWTDAILRRDVQKKLCAIASGTNPVTGIDTKESLLC